VVVVLLLDVVGVMVTTVVSAPESLLEDVDGDELVERIVSSVPLEESVVVLLLPDELPFVVDEEPPSGLDCPSMPPTPQPMAVPFGCVGFGAATVVPSASAMVKRVVYVGLVASPLLMNW